MIQRTKRTLRRIRTQAYTQTRAPSAYMQLLVSSAHVRARMPNAQMLTGRRRLPKAHQTRRATRWQLVQARHPTRHEEALRWVLWAWPARRTRGSAAGVALPSSDRAGFSDSERAVALNLMGHAHAGTCTAALPADEAMLARTRTNVGSLAAWRRVVRRLDAGEELSVVVLGVSRVRRSEYRGASSAWHIATVASKAL